MTMRDGAESYLEKCVAALPPEKRALARAAFAEIADGGDDSYLSKLLALLEANNAYARSIPVELATVHQNFLSDLDREMKYIREQQLAAEATRNTALGKLLHQEVQLLDKTQPLTAAIDAIRQQAQLFAQVKSAMLESPLRVQGLIRGLMAGFLIGVFIGVGGTRVLLNDDLRRAADAADFLDHAERVGVHLQMQPGANGTLLRVTASTPVLGSQWQRDPTGKITGVEIEYSQPAAP